MTRSSDVSEALSRLQSRWGAAAPRRGGELMIEGTLARVPMPIEPDPGEMVEPAPTPLAPFGTPGLDERAAELDGRVVSTGFATLDALLGTGGIPRSDTVALRGDVSSGKTTVALRAAARAQAAGAIVAWLDLARAFDAVEAVARGVRLEWLVVLTPVDLEEALSLAASLLSTRTVDMLVLDLPDGWEPALAGVSVGDRPGRLAALARRAGALLLVVEPATIGAGLRSALHEASGLRLELTRTGWIRLGRDVVGQRSTVTVARSRHGPPGGCAELRILYAEGGARDACLARDELLDGRPTGVPPGTTLPGGAPPDTIEPAHTLINLKGPPLSADSHASAAPDLAPPSAPARPGPSRDPDRGRHRRLVAVRPDRPRWTALDGWDGGRRGSARQGPRRAPRDLAWGRPPARARGDLPRPRV